VWCNGVLMHTAEPARTLTEIIRVLEPAGSAWIYVYGRGGVYWRTIAQFRRTFADVPSMDLIRRLVDLDLPNGRIAEMIDDWKAPFLRNYSESLWLRALSDLNCEYTRLMRGTDYDTCEQLARGGSPDLLGEGDLRFLITKRETAIGPLSPDTRASLNGSHLDQMDFTPFADERSEERLSGALAGFENRWRSDPLGGVAAAMTVQLFLRDVFLRSPSPASLERLVELLDVN